MLSLLSTEGENDCCLEDVLVFFTGADQVPPLGFDKDCQLIFILYEIWCFCPNFLWSIGQHFGYRNAALGVISTTDFLNVYAV